MKPTLYLAGPLFSEAERTFNEELAERLSVLFDVFLPQRDNLLLVDLVSDGVPQREAQERIFHGDIAAVDNATYFLILLDGRAVDEGACFELGYAYSKGKVCLGLQTDPRRLLLDRNNPMIDVALSLRFERVDALIHWTEDKLQNL